MTPNYVAKKSIVTALSPLCIIFFWLIVPLIIQIYRIVEAKNSVVEFYDEKVVVKGGVFSKYERDSVFAGVYSISLNQSFLGRIFNYGDVAIDAPGDWDVYTNGIKDPNSLRNYLKDKITARGIKQVITD